MKTVAFDIKKTDKVAFEKAAHAQDLKSAQLLRKLISEYLNSYGKMRQLPN